MCSGVKQYKSEGWWRRCYSKTVNGKKDVVTSILLLIWHARILLLIQKQ
jgi:hypothetical protein